MEYDPENEHEGENEWDDGDEYTEENALEDLSDIKPELKKLYQQHPECNLDYVEQVIPKLHLETVPAIGKKVDQNHRTYPFVTNYEKTKIIGLRANQLSKGAIPLITVPKHVTDVRDIARLEFAQKRLPFIIKRPLPNGSFEYWRLIDLMII
jgi:DNA-directed RNA polymerase I, II, and III subunit RPABC2